MIGALIDMALASWEKAITPPTNRFEYEQMAALLSAVSNFNEYVNAIKRNGITLRFDPIKDGPK